MCLWFRFGIFLAIIVTVTHLFWNRFLLTEMCTVPICKSKPGPEIDARSSLANESHMVSTKTTFLASSAFIQNCSIFVDYTVV